MLAALDHLHQFIEAEEYDTYYLTLTKLLKKYINKKYHQQISELTTTEIKSRLDLPHNTKQELISLLRSFDTAKFARMGNEAETATQILEQVTNDIKSGVL